MDGGITCMEKCTVPVLKDGLAELEVSFRKFCEPSASLSRPLTSSPFPQLAIPTRISYLSDAGRWQRACLACMWRRRRMAAPSLPCRPSSSSTKTRQKVRLLHSAFAPSLTRHHRAAGAGSASKRKAEPPAPAMLPAPKMAAPSPEPQLPLPPAPLAAPAAPAAAAAAAAAVEEDTEDVGWGEEEGGEAASAAPPSTSDCVPAAAAIDARTLLLEAWAKKWLNFILVDHPRG